MTNLTPEIIESATLNTPYYIDKSFSTDEGVNVAAICDVNGFHVFDCYESDAEEIIKRINGYEQQAETIERLNKVMNKVRDDLLERADIDTDGTRAVNLSHSVWLEFCDAIDKTN